MSNKKPQSKAVKLFLRIFISSAGAALILAAFISLSLYVFGDTVQVKVNTRRYGGADHGRPSEARYLWSLDYSFVDKNGVLHSGSATRRGSDFSVKTDSRVYYFQFAAYISALESDAKPSAAQPVFIVCGAFLIFLMNRKGGKGPGKNKKVAEKSKKTTK